MRAGVAVNSLGISQMAFEVTKQINNIKNLDEYWDIIVFYHTYDRIINSPLFCMLHEQELWGFDGPVIATDLSTADRLLKCPCPTKKFFYMWDLEWLMSQYDVDLLASVYMNPELDLIARSEHHASIIKDCWKEPVATIEDFNYEQITSLLKQKS